MKRKVGILCACDAELKPFLERLRPQRSEVHAMRTFHIGRLGDVEAVLVCCGICKVNAALAAQLLIDRLGVDAVVCAGTAGGMAPEVGLFDTVIAERMVYHDIADGLLSACHPRMERDGFRADPELLAAARVYAATAEWPVRFGTTATGERFITERRREEINRLYAPLAVDMGGGRRPCLPCERHALPEHPNNYGYCGVLRHGPFRAEPCGGFAENGRGRAGDIGTVVRRGGQGLVPPGASDP